MDERDGAPFFNLKGMTIEEADPIIRSCQEKLQDLLRNDTLTVDEYMWASAAVYILSNLLQQQPEVYDAWIVVMCGRMCLRDYVEEPGEVGH